MNVLALLNNELQDKNWTLEEKSRYLFVRSCQFFSYDQRYLFWEQIPNGKKLRDSIQNASISLEDLQNNLVICRSCIRSVVSILFSELLNQEVEFQWNGNHMYGTILINGQTILLDSTDYYDLFRTKYSMSTYGYDLFYHPRDVDFSKRLYEIDKKIGYIEDNYYDAFLKKEIYHSLRNYLFQFHHGSLKSILLYKMQLLQSFFRRLFFSSFSDASQCITYLLKHIFGSDVGRVVISPLFDMRTMEDWDFVTIYSLMIHKEVFYYVLRKEKNRFLLEEISSIDVKHYKNHMQGIARSLIP